MHRACAIPTAFTPTKNDQETPILCVFKTRIRYKAVTVRTKRAQSALEFMTTYGWAILVIAIALGVLYSMGVFNLASTTPDICTLSSNVGCLSASLSSTGQLTVNIEQATQDTINVISIGCNDQGVLRNMVLTSPPTTLYIGQNAIFTVQCYQTVRGALTPYSGQIGDAFKGFLIVNYTNLNSGFPHTSQGPLIEKVQQ